MEVKTKEQKIEHLELKLKELEVDAHISRKKSEGLDEEIER
jgi:hypothetical protein